MSYVDYFREYIEKAKRANTHTAKVLILSEMLKTVFNVKLEELIPGVEKKLGSKIWGIKGSADLIFTNVVFEVKVNLKREESDAKEQLKKYFQALYEGRPNERFVGIATDCLIYKAYRPIIKNDVVSDVREISSLNVIEKLPQDSILWLDSYIFSMRKIRPTAEDLKWRFGPYSGTYSLAVDELASLWNEIEDEEDARLKYELWLKNMEIVYGSKPQLESFLTHTYLVTLVKLIVYLRLSGDHIIEPDKVSAALSGEYFLKYGIVNLIEEDFFTWILHPKIADKAINLACGIAKELLRYDFSKIDEDFFKEIYQEIVERGERHRIGEYYTPEWLAELTIKEAYTLWKEKHDGIPRFLDPFCGSGTFLCNAIHYLRDDLERANKSKDEMLEIILNSVVGADINPLAVTIARANFIIALRDLVVGRTIILPVYVADTVKIPKMSTLYEYTANEEVKVYDIEVNGLHIQVPTRVANHRLTLGKVLEGFKEGVECYRIRRDRNEASQVLKRRSEALLTEGEFNVLKMTLDTILNLVDKNQDTIWIYLINNLYAPVALKESKFDILISNPPWIAMRYIENKSYQDFLKNEIIKNYELLKSEQVHLFTQMEAATLCFSKAADLYLKENGVISFVMPRSILTGASQHEEFKKFKKPKMALKKILDFEDVNPLFNVPCCVLMCVKGGETSYPITAYRYDGKLPMKNLKLSDALIHLKRKDYSYEPPKLPSKYSYYYNKIKAGAAIYPRCFYFVEFEVHPTLGIDFSLPAVKTSSEIQEKPPWKGIRLSQNVEPEFLYVTILSTDLLNFGIFQLRLILLPIIPTASRYMLLDVEELRRQGYSKAASWFEMVQNYWQEKASEKSKHNFPRAVSAIDHLGLLSKQNPNTEFLLIYNTSGTNLASCVIHRRSLEIKVGNETFKPKGFVAEKKTMIYETNNENEAHYLCSILNSNVINEKIKPFQTRGLWGERDIIRRPFMFPIPRFDENNGIHKRLAELSKYCHRIVASLRLDKKSVATLRRQTREAVKEQLSEIDELVSQLLGMKS